MCLISVVFPLPRKPVRIVTGTGGSGDGSSVVLVFAFVRVAGCPIQRAVAVAVVKFSKWMIFVLLAETNKPISISCVAMQLIKI